MSCCRCCRCEKVDRDYTIAGLTMKELNLLRRVYQDQQEDYEMDPDIISEAFKIKRWSEERGYI